MRKEFRSVGEHSSQFAGRRFRLLFTSLRLGIMSLFLLGPYQASAQVNLPVDVERAFSDVSRLIVMITADWGGAEDARKGTGIIVGFDSSAVYLVTASHVVWSGETPAAKVIVEVRAFDGSVWPIEAKVLPSHDPPDKNGQRGLDLAVLSFGMARGIAMAFAGLPLNVLGQSSLLKNKEKMYAVGYANGEKKWNIGPESERFSELRQSILTFGSSSISEGYSGGPIFNSRFQLVGMVTMDRPPTGEALTIERLSETLRQWQVPLKLEIGGGRTIITEEDRPSYPLTDAKASVSIYLPVDSSDFQPFVSQLKASITDFSNKNPNYDNQSPRELYYLSYTDQGGKRNPTDVTIYTDSPYWPKYAEYPLVALLARIQSTSFNFYTKPIDPKTFSPTNPPADEKADLSITVSKNYVQFTTLERQLQYEGNWGRLELSQSLTDGTLKQFGWNSRALQSDWRTNGAISSLLDLRGTQLIISTVVGNLGNRADLKGAFTQLRSQTKLEYIIFSLGNRSVELRLDDMRRFLGKDGSPYYVYEFPKTSQEFFQVMR